MATLGHEGYETLVAHPNRPAMAADVRSFPSEDGEFARAAEDALAAALARIGMSDEVMRDVSARLAEHYPGVTVRPQDPLARLGHDIVIYAFRDGTIRVGPTRSEQAQAGQRAA